VSGKRGLFFAYDAEYVTSVCTGALIPGGSARPRLPNGDYARLLQLLFEYDPQRPFDAGSAL
jgi:hypothetical protein